MSIISKTPINSNLLAQQFAKVAARQALYKEQSQTVADNSVPTKPDVLNSQLTSFINRMNDAKQAINKLGDATREISQSRKAFAAEMLKRIKDQIRLMMLMTGGDPKARARQIAAMAKELAAAAREYAAASGDATPVSEAPASSGEQSNSSTAAASTAESTTSAASVAEQSDPAAENTVPTPTAVPGEAMPYQPNSTHQVYEQLANKISEYSRTSASSKEDQEFAMEVRKLAAQLKALAKQNEVHAHKGIDQSTEQETADTNEALREVEHSLAIIESPEVSSPPSINIVAG
jgi:hypothetical protein